MVFVRNKVGKKNTLVLKLQYLLNFLHKQISFFWTLTLVKKMTSKESGYYSCKASNTFGTTNTEMNLQMIPAITPDAIDGYDDITVYHDDTVVSGEISDAEFYQSMVTSFQ